MLAVEQHFAAFGFGGAHAVPDRGQHLVLGGLQRHAHVIVPDFATKQMSACASSSATRPGSFDTERPGRRVMPKAVRQVRSGRFSAKKLVSVGLAPG